MANQKLTQLTRITSTDGNEQLYVVDAPDTSPISRSIHVSSLDYRNAAYGALGTRALKTQLAATAASIAAGTIFSALDTVAGPTQGVTSVAFGSNYSGFTFTTCGIYSIDFRSTFVRVGLPTSYALTSVFVGLNHVTLTGLDTPNEHECATTITSATLALGQSQYYNCQISAIRTIQATESVFMSVWLPADGILASDTLFVQSASFVVKRIG